MEPNWVTPSQVNQTSGASPADRPRASVSLGNDPLYFQFLILTTLVSQDPAKYHLTLPASRLAPWGFPGWPAPSFWTESRLAEVARGAAVQDTVRVGLICLPEESTFRSPLPEQGWMWGFPSPQLYCPPLSLSLGLALSRVVTASLTSMSAP